MHAWIIENAKNFIVAIARWLMVIATALLVS